MTKEDIIRKLTSRKFWVAVAGLVTGIVAFIKEPTTDAQTITALILALGSVIAYCVGEGLADAANAQAAPTAPTVIYVPSDEMFEEQAEKEAEKAAEKEEGGEE